MKKGMYFLNSKMFNLKPWLQLIEFHIWILLKVKTDNLFFFFSGVSVNFYQERPHPPNPNRDILFHFNPRPPNKLILNTCVKGAWKTEVVLIDDEFTERLFKMPFRLTIEPMDHTGNQANEFEFKVFLNQKPLTWYLCPFDITKTTHLGYSPGLRIQHIHQN